jgi:hypothetical protein
VVFFKRPWRMPGYYAEVAHGRFFLWPFEFNVENYAVNDHMITISYGTSYLEQATLRKKSPCVQQDIRYGNFISRHTMKTLM